MPCPLYPSDRAGMRHPTLRVFKARRAVEILKRHLGLVPSIERGELDSFFAKLVVERLDMDMLLKIAESGRFRMFLFPELRGMQL